MAIVLIRDTLRRDRGGREGQIKMESEIRVLHPQAKECLEPPQAERREKELCSRTFKGTSAQLTL